MQSRNRKLLRRECSLSGRDSSRRINRARLERTCPRAVQAHLQSLHLGHANSIHRSFVGWRSRRATLTCCNGPNQNPTGRRRSAGGFVPFSINAICWHQVAASFVAIGPKRSQRFNQDGFFEIDTAVVAGRMWLSIGRRCQTTGLSKRCRSSARARLAWDAEAQP